MSKVVKTSLQSITSEFKNFKEYKENYDTLLYLPIFQKLIKKNKKLEKENKKLLALLFSEKKTHRPSKKGVFIKVEKNFETDERKVTVTDEVKIKKEKTSQLEEVNIVESCDSDDGLLECGIVEKPQNIVYELQDDDDDDLPCLQETFIKECKTVDEAQEEEEEEEVEEEEEEEDELDVEEEEEELDVEEEEEEELDVEEEEEEEDVEEEEEEVKEVLINGKTFYASNEIDSVIYDVDENGDISLEVGIFKNGKAKFN
jgi:hypothetical protein